MLAFCYRGLGQYWQCQYFHLDFYSNPSLRNGEFVKKKKDFVVTCTPSISTRLEQKAVDLSRHQSLNGVARQFGVGVIIEKAIYAIEQACQHRCFSSFPSLTKTNSDLWCCCPCTV